jgi:hypothetical protein
MATWARHELAVAALREVVVRCAHAGIPLLAVKGAVTSKILYKDVASRPMRDVDIRIRSRDFGAFRNLAAAAGWSRKCVSVIRRNLVYDINGIELDVECTVGPPGVCALTVEKMLSRAEFLTIGGENRVLIPETHDHAVLLVVNVFKDKLFDAQAVALSDLQRIVIAPRFRRKEFASRVTESQVATLAWVVAGWMHGREESVEWGSVRAAIEERTRPRQLYAKVLNRLLQDPTRAPLTLRLLARFSADRSLMRAKALMATALWSAEMRLRRFG